MAGLVASDRARAAVRAFLSRPDDLDSDADSVDRQLAPSAAAAPLSDADSDSEHETLERAAKTAARHPRLGLGATFDSRQHAPQLTEEERRIAGGLRAAAAREKARVDDHDLDEPDGVYGEVDSKSSKLKSNSASKTARIAKKKKKQHNKASKVNPMALRGKPVAQEVSSEKCVPLLSSSPASDSDPKPVVDANPSLAPPSFDPSAAPELKRKRGGKANRARKEAEMTAKAHFIAELPQPAAAPGSQAPIEASLSLEAAAAAAWSGGKPEGTNHASEGNTEANANDPPAKRARSDGRSMIPLGIERAEAEPTTTPARRRTKTRSKQKNLRRDTRPARGALPAHLNEESLAARSRAPGSGFHTKTSNYVAVTEATTVAPGEKVDAEHATWFVDRSGAAMAEFRSGKA
jgi:hypothetical protein